MGPVAGCWQVGKCEAYRSNQDGMWPEPPQLSRGWSCPGEVHGCVGARQGSLEHVSVLEMQSSLVRREEQGGRAETDGCRACGTVGAQWGQLPTDWQAVPKKAQERNLGRRVGVPIEIA